MVKGGKILVDVCANVKKKEKVVIVTDFPNIKFAEILATISIDREAEVALLVMEPRSAHGAEPPEAISSAMLTADIIFAPTKYSLTHSSAKVKACQNGARFVNMVDYTKEMMVQGGLFEDFNEQKMFVTNMANLLSESEKAEISSPKGTKLFLSLKNRKGKASLGMAHEPGSSCSPPDIEAAISPMEETSEGLVVVDGSIPIPEIRKVNKPITIFVEKGFIKSIEGEEEARILQEVLRSFNDPNVYSLAELGFGMNRKSKLIGTMLEDEGAYGTVHFGFGDNHSLGGKVRAKTHIDFIITEPTVKLDDTIILKKGEYLCK